MTWPQKPSNVVHIADHVQARLTRHLACLRDEPGLTDAEVIRRLGYDRRRNVRLVPARSPFEGIRPMDRAEFQLDDPGLDGAA